MGWETVFIYQNQLSLAIPRWVGTMSSSQWAMVLCGWGVGAGITCLVADNNNNNNIIIINNNTKIYNARSHTLSMNQRSGQVTRWPDGVC